MPIPPEEASVCPRRREFLKLAAAGLVGASLTGCSEQEEQGGSGSAAPLGTMSTRSSRSGDKIGLLGYGCMRWPMMDDPATGKRIIDQERTNEMVDHALAHGINYFDTAPRYQHALSEQAMGHALSRHPRDKYFIATKLSNQYEDDSERTFEGAKAMLERSMKRLQVDYIDYYLIHSIGLEKGKEGLDARIVSNGFLPYLKELKKKGTIRNIGFSYHGDVKLFDYMLDMDIEWDCCLIQLNFRDMHNATGNSVNSQYLYKRLQEKKIPIQIMGALRGGSLVGMPNIYMEELKRREPHMSIASWGFRYAGSFPEVLCVLSGMGTMEHLNENIRTFSPFKPLNAEEMQTMEHIGARLAESQLIGCTSCQYCMPCPYGIDIPGTFEHYNRCVNEGIIDKSSRSESYNEAREAFLYGYDRKVEKLRQAPHCIGCNKCEKLCPQRIKIANEMQKIAQYREKLMQNKI